MHEYLKSHDVLGKMQAAFEVIPDQKLKPADAYHEVVRRNVEFVFLDDMMNRIPAVMMVPYPPGIPIVAPGEQITQEAVDVITRYRQMSLPVQGVDHDAITILKLC